MLAIAEKASELRPATSSAISTINVISIALHVALPNGRDPDLISLRSCRVIDLAHG